MTIMNRSFEELRGLSRGSVPKKVVLKDIGTSPKGLHGVLQKPKALKRKKKKRDKLKKLKKRPRMDPSTPTSNDFSTKMDADFASGKTSVLSLVEDALKKALLAVAEASSFATKSPSIRPQEVSETDEESSDAVGLETPSPSNVTIECSLPTLSSADKTSSPSNHPKKASQVSSDNIASLETLSLSSATITSDDETSPSKAKPNDITSQDTPSRSIAAATTDIPIISRKELMELVQDLDSEQNKAEFAWKYNNHQLKKGQTKFWYDFRPQEMYCAEYAFVPLQYTSLLPAGTPKNQIKRKTTALVLEKGIQGIHFAIGWVELYNLIVDNGVFAHNEDDEDHPTLVEFHPPTLDPNANITSPTLGSILCESQMSRNAACGKKQYTPTSGLQGAIALVVDKDADATVPAIQRAISSGIDSSPQEDKTIALAVENGGGLNLPVKRKVANCKYVSSMQENENVVLAVENEEGPGSGGKRKADNSEQIPKSKIKRTKKSISKDKSDIREFDVLFGRGVGLLRHPGNAQLRSTVERHARTFENATGKEGQLTVAAKVHKKLQTKGVRFWKEDRTEASSEEARQKILLCWKYRSRKMKKQQAAAAESTVVKIPSNLKSPDREHDGIRSRSSDWDNESVEFDSGSSSSAIDEAFSEEEVEEEGATQKRGRFSKKENDRPNSPPSSDCSDDDDILLDPPATPPPSPPLNEEEHYKWANWRPSTPPTPPTQYWIDHYGAVDV